MKITCAPFVAAIVVLSTAPPFARTACAQQQQQQQLEEQLTSAKTVAATDSAQSAPAPQQNQPQPTTSRSDAPSTTLMSETDRLPFMQVERPPASAEAPDSFGLLMRTVGALLLIVGLIFGAGWGLRRFGGTRFGAAQPDAPPLAVVSTVSLGERRSLAIVKFGARTLLVGSTAQAITLIAEEEETEDHAPSPARSVASMLRQQQQQGGSDDESAFAYEMMGAEKRLELIPGGWHALDREGAAS
ncbi:MAG: flagellar biosynthetic protein FliO [Pyrinomonadaceae bacterium]